MDDLISRQAAIEALRKLREEDIEDYGCEIPEGFNQDHLDRATFAIKQLPHIQPEPHWIPVTKDTLPERNRVVVVCGEKGTWDFGTYRGHGNDIHYWNWKKNTYKRVYWWMYKENALPEPCKEVTE